jgi:hypothetical protein
MQAIQTRYIPAGRYGARIAAECERGGIRIPFPYEAHDTEAAHVAAAQALCEKFAQEDSAGGCPREGNPWLRPRAVGALPDGYYAHVFTS